jgi:hypothetical protein
MGNFAEASKLLEGQANTVIETTDPARPNAPMPYVAVQQGPSQAAPTINQAPMVNQAPTVNQAALTVNQAAAPPVPPADTSTREPSRNAPDIQPTPVARPSAGPSSARKDNAAPASSLDSGLSPLPNIGASRLPPTAPRTSAGTPTRPSQHHTGDLLLEAENRSYLALLPRGPVQSSSANHTLNNHAPGEPQNALLRDRTARRGPPFHNTNPTQGPPSSRPTLRTIPVHTPTPQHPPPAHIGDGVHDPGPTDPPVPYDLRVDTARLWAQPRHDCTELRCDEQTRWLHRSIWQYEARCVVRAKGFNPIWREFPPYPRDDHFWVEEQVQRGVIRFQERLKRIFKGDGAKEKKSRKRRNSR